MLSSPTFLDPREKPDKKPPFIVVEITFLNASITMTNNKGNKGSPCLKPQELLKKSVGVSLTKIEKRTKKIQWLSNYTISPQNSTSSTYTTKNSNSHDYRPGPYPIYKAHLAPRPNPAVKAFISNEERIYVLPPC